MKVTKLFLKCYENSKHDGTSHWAELHSVQLDDPDSIPYYWYVACSGEEHYTSTKLDELGYPDFSDKVVLPPDEVAQFDAVIVALDTSLHNTYTHDGKETVRVDGAFLHTSNPTVYGTPDKYLNFCGVQVLTEDVNEYTIEDGGEDYLGPFVVDLSTAPELVEYALEGSSHNEHASCVVLYYAGVPSREQVIKDLVSLKGKLGLSCDTADPTLSYEEFPTKVSKRANLRRYECGPCG